MLNRSAGSNIANRNHPRIDIFVLWTSLVLAAMGLFTVLSAAEAPWFSRSLVGLEVGPTGA